MTVVVAFAVWPVIAVILFATMPLRRAVILNFALSYLFLPSNAGINLPGLPKLDRETLPALVALILCIFMSRGQFALIPKSKAVLALIALALIAPWGTALTNSDPLISGDIFKQGLRPWDGVSQTANAVFALIPFLIGRSLMATKEAHEDFVKIIVILGAGYCLLAILEVMIAPILHQTVYGFHPQDFRQQIRFGGYRPVVFLRHGLWMAFTAMTFAACAAILWRASGPQFRGPAGLLTGYFSFVLVLCKSVGSLVHGLIMLPTLFLAGKRTQLLLAAFLCTFAMVYPITRAADIVPTESIVAFFDNISEERADSLDFRFRNENDLLDHAMERPIFGWGGWGRNRAVGESTKDFVVTDGRWIIWFGTQGFVGYIAYFGLLAIPVLQVRNRLRKSQQAIDGTTFFTTGICLLVGINMLEMLPNVVMPSWTFLLAGGLAGYAEKLRQPDEGRSVEAVRSRAERARMAQPVATAPRTKPRTVI